MALRVVREEHFEARPEAEFSFPSTDRPVGQLWLDTLIRVNELPYNDGFGGGPGWYEGLNERVENRIGKVIPECTDGRGDSKYCPKREEITATHDGIQVKLSCGVVSGEDEAVVDEQADTCEAHFEACQGLVETWLLTAEDNIRGHQAAISEHEVAIRTHKTIIADLI